MKWLSYESKDIDEFTNKVWEYMNGFNNTNDWNKNYINQEATDYYTKFVNHKCI